MKVRTVSLAPVCNAEQYILKRASFRKRVRSNLVIIDIAANQTKDPTENGETRVRVIWVHTKSNLALLEYLHSFPWRRCLSVPAIYCLHHCLRWSVCTQYTKIKL